MSCDYDEQEKQGRTLTAQYLRSLSEAGFQIHVVHLELTAPCASGDGGTHSFKVQVGETAPTDRRKLH